MSALGTERRDRIQCEIRILSFDPRNCRRKDKRMRKKMSAKRKKKMSTKKKVLIGAGVIATALYVVPRLGGVMMFGPRVLLPGG